MHLFRGEAAALVGAAVTANEEPRTEWHVAEMAHGSAVSGSAKLREASTTPSAEFCMPVSIETVRATSSGLPSSLGTV
jgi:hypothetical protein